MLMAEDLRPRTIIRWAVGTPEGRRSSAWRLWGDPKGDTYLAMRSLAGQFKVSIHRDGQCYVGYHGKFLQAAKERFSATSRYFDQW